MSEGGLLETLLWECFEGPATYVADRGLSATIRDVPPNAVVLAFRLDGKAFRRAAGLMDQGKKCCDGLLVAMQKVPEKPPQLAFFLLEMKGSSLSHALEQLGDALNALRKYLSERVRQEVLGRARFIPVIISDRAASIDLTVQLDAFKETHRTQAFVHNLNGVDQTTDLSQLLNQVWRRGRS